MAGQSGAMSSCRITCISFVVQSSTLNRCQSSCRNGSNGRVNEWRARSLHGIGDPGLKQSGTVWQEEFFDHVLRSSESYSQKWEYVKENPVRAGLVKKSDDWPFQGEIESLML